MSTDKILEEKNFNRYFGADVPTQLQEAQLDHYWDSVEAYPPVMLSPNKILAVREWYRRTVRLLETLALKDPQMAQQIALQQAIDEMESKP